MFVNVDGEIQSLEIPFDESTDLRRILMDVAPEVDEDGYHLLDRKTFDDLEEIAEKIWHYNSAMKYIEPELFKVIMEAGDNEEYYCLAIAKRVSKLAEIQGEQEVLEFNLVA